MTLVNFGATCSPFLLAATLRHHALKFREEFPKEHELVEKCVYVDDLISGADSETEAMDIHREMKDVMQRASFNMRKWMTSSRTLQQKWREGKFWIASLLKTVVARFWDTSGKATEK
ncbi:hypothetical protein AVEN_75489-1 [Araneus ventricosus]|uniref:Reverse transcriptase domain-containing protein n=1 Tax=Araneus ventricosus TaxID=182803 RepID=A0A4Y2DMM3_ARAVE|nr:hypothetical protein AVEN_75489-1 [Araneus ventricosus]